MGQGRRIRWLAGLALLSLGMTATPAAAEDGVLYEVAENMRIKAGKVTRRVAWAALVGRVNGNTPWCPAVLGLPRCDVTAIGTDSIDVTTGRGPVGASFTVVVQGDNEVDGPEFSIIKGTLWGSIDLSPAVLGPDGVPGTGDEMPLGTLTGVWTAYGVGGGPIPTYRASGHLTGVFRLPFRVGGSPPLYLGAGYVPVPVQDQEQSLQVPTVRLEVTFD